VVFTHELAAGAITCGAVAATSSTHAFTAWLEHGVVGESPGAFRATSSVHPRTHAEADEQLRWLASSVRPVVLEERAEEWVSATAEPASRSTRTRTRMALTG